MPSPEQDRDWLERRVRVLSQALDLIGDIANEHPGTDWAEVEDIADRALLWSEPPRSGKAMPKT